MSSNTLIGDFATGLWLDLGQPPIISALTISGYATQPYTLGQLNVKIGTCYTSSGFRGTGTIFDITPSGISNTELAIIGAMYKVSFYNQMAQRSMGGMDGVIPWSRLREADSDITRSNPASLGKEFRELAKDANAQLNYLVNTYLVNSGSAPRSVDYLNPSPVAAYPYNPAGVAYRT